MKVSFGNKPLKDFRLTGKISGKAHRVLLHAIEKSEKETGFAPPIHVAIDALILRATSTDKDLMKYIADAEKSEKKTNGKTEEAKPIRAIPSPVADLKPITSPKINTEMPIKQVASA